MTLEVFGLAGKSAIVTGASRGLGKAIALSLAQAGAEVVVTSRTKEEIEAAAAEISQKTGKRIVPVQSDVGKHDQVEKLIDVSLRELGKVDILVNNAGINIRKPLIQLDDDTWDRILQANLTGPMLCCRAIGPHMIERQQGKIINICSMLSFVALTERTPYCSSKGGLFMFTRVLALEWAEHNIQVNAICPGPFNTEINRTIFAKPEIREQFLSKVPLGRFGEPEEVGAAAVFLASRASDYMTGSPLFVDGGWSAH